MTITVHGKRYSKFVVAHIGLFYDHKYTCRFANLAAEQFGSKDMLFGSRCSITAHISFEPEPPTQQNFVLFRLSARLELLILWLPQMAQTTRLRIRRSGKAKKIEALLFDYYREH